MSGKGQQDAQEWFMCIVDRLHEGVATTTDPDKQCNCFFHKVFYGRFRSEITCDTCHRVSSREDEFSTIPLDFKKQVKKRKKAAKEAALKEAAAKEQAQKEKEANGDDSTLKKSKTVPPAELKIQTPTLTDMLKQFTFPEPLSPEQYTCTTCNSRRSAYKQTRVRKLPHILGIHVKRFGMKQLATGAYVPEKYEGKMDFSLTLDMADYTTCPPYRNGYTNGYAAHVNGDTNGERVNMGQYSYDLDCVVVHQGEHAQNGHYFAFCRQDNKWFRFDDEIVSATTTEDVLRQEAYLLFYSQRKILIEKS
jgi:ubiquitin carboxyl-terminal hydrolase 22/27/51